MTVTQVSQAPAETTRNRKKARRTRSKVEHYYWIKDGQAAQEMGVQVRHVCGTWSDYVPTWHKLIPRQGVRPVPEARDCKRCIKSLEAAWRRQLTKQFLEAISR